MPGLESQIDELYQAPLEEFTAARNALAKTVSKSDAVRIKKLAKPTLVPWAINQIFWNARPTWDRLLRSGETLRTAQLGALKGRNADVRAASDALRQAVSDAVKAGERLGVQAGASPPPDALMRALEALSLMSARPDPPGRLTEAPRPAGFEALTGIKVPEVPEVRGVRKVPEGGSVRLQPDRALQPDHPRRPDHLKLQPDPKKEAARKREEAAARKAAEKAAAEEKKRQAAIKRAEAALAAAQAKLAKLKSG